jgi:hypothetical protein
MPHNRQGFLMKLGQRAFLRDTLRTALSGSRDNAMPPEGMSRKNKTPGYPLNSRRIQQELEPKGMHEGIVPAF